VAGQLTLEFDKSLAASIASASHTADVAVPFYLARTLKRHDC